jgi:hypothetical protein
MAVWISGCRRLLGAGSGGDVAVIHLRGGARLDGRRFSTAVSLIAISVACAAGRDMLFQLENYRPQTFDPRQIEVQATVLGPQTGLRYKWFSVDGDFDPQQSYEPKTQFTFAPNAARDRIWVEVWREDEKIAESAMDVNVEAHAPVSKENAPVPK